MNADELFDDYTVLGSITVAKVLDADGDIAYVERASQDLLIPELIGMLQLTLHRLTRLHWGES